MRIFEPNAELVNVLTNFGFSDFATEIETLKGKKWLKLHNSSPKVLYLTYNTELHLIVNGNGHDCITRMSEHELRLLLMFFKMPYSDFKELLPSGVFKFKAISERFDFVKRDLNNLIN